MSRKSQRASLPELLELVRDKVRPPVGIILGSPREAATLVEAMPGLDVVCYQMDLYQASRVEEELRLVGAKARVASAPDLWDRAERMPTLLYPVPPKGERGLKLDIIEQAFHTLTDGGYLIVLSPYEREHFFPEALKKVFGRAHGPVEGHGQVLWCRRQGDKPRRRHEITFQVRGEQGTSLRFVSRPGVFSYGRFDEGARALVEVMEIQPGNAVLDLGCGCGVVGVFAGLRGGPETHVTFVDSNVRAVALAHINARSAGLANVDAIATPTLERFGQKSFDVIVANPPYYAQQSIARSFIEGSRRLLRSGGRFYLVTKQADQVEEWISNEFRDADAVSRRGYIVFRGRVR